MDGFDALRAVGALLLTLGLMLGSVWLLRRFGGGYLQARRPHRSDLSVVEWKSLDTRRRLAVVKWDEREHLLCLGPAGDCLIASRPAPPAAEAPQ